MTRKSGEFGEAKRPRWSHASRIATGEGHSECEDAIIVDPSIGLFGVFDGVGSDNGALASATAANTVGQYLRSLGQQERADENSPRQALELASENIAVGSTTASVGVLVETDDGTRLNFAHVGDSRILIIRSDGSVEQVTKDESINGSCLIYNSLGSGYCGVRQAGSVLVRDGDRIAFLTDGVTGDVRYKSDEDAHADKNGNYDLVLSNDKIAAATVGYPDEAATDRVMAARRKTYDDASIVIATIGGCPTEWDNFATLPNRVSGVWANSQPRQISSLVSRLVKKTREAWQDLPNSARYLTVVALTSLAIALAAYLYGGTASAERPEASAPPSLQTEPQTEVVINGVKCQLRTVQVSAGDTLSALTGGDPDQLAWAISYNGISNPDLIQPGQTLILPEACK